MVSTGNGAVNLNSGESGPTGESIRTHSPASKVPFNPKSAVTLTKPGFVEPGVRESVKIQNPRPVTAAHGPNGAAAASGGQSGHGITKTPVMHAGSRQRTKGLSSKSLPQEHQSQHGGNAVASYVGTAPSQ